jgi:hypothetical protein
VLDVAAIRPSKPTGWGVLKVPWRPRKRRVVDNPDIPDINLQHMIALMLLDIPSRGS